MAGPDHRRRLYDHRVPVPVPGLCLNALSPRLAGKFQVSTTVIKMVPLVLMAVVGTVLGLTNGRMAENFATMTTATISTGEGLMASTVAVAFAYEGWILATSINAELKDAKRNLPRALILAPSLWWLLISSTISASTAPLLRRS